MKHYDKTIEIACWKSCEKWLKIFNFEGIDDGIENCALCKLFFYGGCKLRHSGEKCPVYEESGFIGCENTPFSTWITFTISLFDDTAVKCESNLEDDLQLLQERNLFNRRQELVMAEYKYLVDIALSYGDTNANILDEEL